MYMVVFWPPSQIASGLLALEEILLDRDRCDLIFHSPATGIRVGVLLLLNQGDSEKRFTYLNVRGWRQFADVHLDFDKRLTIITGANGAGKTTLLNLLAPHVGWNVPFVSLPTAFRGVAQRSAQFVSNVWAALSSSKSSNDSDSADEFGEVGFESGSVSKIAVTRSVPGSHFAPVYLPRRLIAGIYIPSHRPVYSTSDSGSISRGKVLDFTQASEMYSQAIRTAWTGERLAGESPFQILTSTLLGWSRENKSAFADFGKTLSMMLPPKLGFTKLLIQEADVLFETRTGIFAIEAVSGGVAAIIDITWQLFLYSRRSDIGDGFVAIIDEPENHLHPELQRSILFNLTETFPQAQFIVATHAPLVVTSVKDAVVYALGYADEMVTTPEADGPDSPDWRLPTAGASYAKLVDVSSFEPESGPAPRIVEAVRLSGFQKSGNANHILTTVLGLDYTMPVWAAKVIESAVDRVSNLDYSTSALAELKSTLVSNDLGQYMPDALTKVIQSEKNPPSDEPELA